MTAILCACGHTEEQHAEDLVAEIKLCQRILGETETTLEHTDEALQASRAEVLRLQSEKRTAFEAGLKAVTRIRCLAHRDVPAYNSNEASGAECPACEVEAQKAEARRLRDALETCLRTALPENAQDYDESLGIIVSTCRAALAQEPPSASAIKSVTS